MSLPNVTIEYAQGRIGATGGQASEYGLLASMAAPALATPGSLELGKAYLLTRLSDLEALGVDSGSTGANGTVYETVKEFYAAAGDGVRLWLLGVPATVTQEDMVDKDHAQRYGKKLLEAAGGGITVLMTKVTDTTGYQATLTDAIDGNIEEAIENAQALAEWAAEELKAPLMVLLEGRHYTGVAAELPDLTEQTADRVAVVLGDSKPGSVGAAVGMVGGRIAAIPVQRSIARVKDGNIGSQMYLGSAPAELGQPDVVHDLGYICPRTFVGKAGYYWSDDTMAVSPSSDYALIPRRRTADKAYRIAYGVLVEELNDELEVNGDGTILEGAARYIESVVEDAIVNAMGNAGELGSDPDDPKDRGVRCVVDRTTNVAATNQIYVDVAIRPFGYAKYVSVTLGFGAGLA